MQYSITLDLADRTATITRYQPGSLGPIRRHTYDLTPGSTRRVFDKLKSQRGRKKWRAKKSTPNTKIHYDSK